MAGVRYSRFRSRWGYRRQIHVPVRIIKGKLLLSPPALAVLFVLLIIAKRTGRAKIGKASLAERTGYSVDTVKTALRELRTARFISSTQTLRKYKEFSTNAYTVAVAQYFTMPRCIVQRDTQDEMWSLSKFTSPEIATYTSACWLADWNHNNTFIPDDLQQITGLVTKAAYDKAMDGLESRGLIMIGVGDVTLCDPYTGLEILPIDDEMENLQNQHTTINGVIHPTVFNFEKTPEFMEKLGTVLGIEFTKSGKNYKTLCLYHTDTRPSLCVDPRGLGQFYCYGCKQAGTLSDIVMKVRGFKNRKDALVFMVEVNGAESHYVDPDHNYTIYSYRDKMGFLKKQEMRHKFKDKSFTQRIPVGAGWEYKQGPPMLYNLDKLQIADTIFMVEGPKDCETIGRHIHDPFIVATTTGGAGTWVDNLADDLIGKRVVLMPDSDTAGEAYADQIADSLTKRGIRFTRISFADEHVKDASTYLVNHSIDDLLCKVGWFIQSEPEPVIQA